MKHYLHGITLYPFPVMIYKPFDGWADNQFKLYAVGVFTWPLGLVGLGLYLVLN